MTFLSCLLLLVVYFYELFTFKNYDFYYFLIIYSLKFYVKWKHLIRHWHLFNFLIRRTDLLEWIELYYLSASMFRKFSFLRKLLNFDYFWIIFRICRFLNLKLSTFKTACIEYFHDFLIGVLNPKNVIKVNHYWSTSIIISYSLQTSNNSWAVEEPSSYPDVSDFW